jgi:hypothetical protein
MVRNPDSIAGIAPEPDDSSSDTSGSDTIKAPTAGLRLPTSETTATMTPDNAHLRMKYSIGSAGIWNSPHT